MNKILILLITFFIIICLPLTAGGKKDKGITNQNNDSFDSSVNSIINPDNTDTLTQASPDAFSEDDAVEIWPSSLQEGEGKKVRLAYKRELPQVESVKFHEVWGYVLEDREDQLSSSMPITDLCYFSADINVYGEITHVPDPERIKNFNGRKHLVITCDSRSLTHFVLDPKYSVREQVIRQIVKAAKLYDGIQIDFELVPAKDTKNFRTFLLDIRGRIGSKKWFTVALPARVKTIEDDIYNYELISSCVDRIIVMAYDQHWSTSKPGPVASMDWCEKIVDYASTVIPPKKLVMGLPFYGRTWEEESLASAWRFEGMNNLLNENDVHEIIRYQDVIPSFSFITQTKVVGYFDDAYSLVERCRLYKNKDVRRIAFWRVGQEDPIFWKYLELE